ncbi:MAG: GTP cyclohydrolase I [Dialister sp.]|nr:GTP cyclohydrolase I [Dialister sp.]
MDKGKLEQAARLIIEAVGEHAEREGLLETPRRFADMMEEQLAYAGVSNEDIAREFDKTFVSDERDMVVVRDIPAFSYCEHHMALMYNMTVTAGYLPRGRVIGLSKIARIADAVSRRLQIQERMGRDIRDILRKVIRTEDVIVLIEGEHSCMTARGIKKPGAKTRTLASSGRFKEDGRLRREFLDLAGK